MLCQCCRQYDKQTKNYQFHILHFIIHSQASSKHPVQNEMSKLKLVLYIWKSLRAINLFILIKIIAQIIIIIIAACSSDGCQLLECM